MAFGIIRYHRKMAKDNQVLVRVNDPTNEAIEDFAEDHDYNKAEAVRRIVEDRLAGQGYLDLPAGSAIPDGGEILSKTEEIGSRTEEIESRVNDLDEQIEEVNEQSGISNRLLLLLSLAFLWIIGDFILGYPDFAVILSGSAWMLAISYVYLIDEVMPSW
jgi:hypothetical protein